MNTQKRLLSYVIALILIVSLNFMLPRFLPGDPLLAIYGEEALVHLSLEHQQEIKEKLGFDRSLVFQYMLYWKGLLQGDLGYSYFYKVPVTQVLKGALPWTLLLVGVSLVLSTLLGLFLGIESGWRRGKTADKAILTSLIFLGSMPDFFLGMVLLIVFGVILKVFPLSGGMTIYTQLSGLPLMVDVLWHLALPAISLTLVRLSNVYLVSRNTMIGVAREPFIFTAKAKGLKDGSIRYRHAGKHVLLPIITQFGIGLGRMATGALFIEIVFSYPGLGMVLQKGLEARDYPLLTGTALAIAIGVLVTSFLMEMIYGKIDPRLNNAY